MKKRPFRLTLCQTAQRDFMEQTIKLKKKELQVPLYVKCKDTRKNSLCMTFYGMSTPCQQQSDSYHHQTNAQKNTSVKPLSIAQLVVTIMATHDSRCRQSRCSQLTQHATLHYIGGYNYPSATALDIFFLLCHIIICFFTKEALKSNFVSDNRGALHQHNSGSSITSSKHTGPPP